MTTAIPFEKVLAEDFSDEQRRRIEKRTQELRAEYKQAAQREAPREAPAKRTEPA